MGIKTYNPYTPSRRHMTGSDFSEITAMKVLNLETNKVRQITDGSTWYSLSGGFNYAWSPDGITFEEILAVPLYLSRPSSARFMNPPCPK